VKNFNSILQGSNPDVGSRFALSISRHLRRGLLSFFVVLALLCAIFADFSLAGGQRQIANVVQRGNFAYAYDAKGLQLFTISAGDGIVGFTQSTVSIRRGNFIHTYNEKGTQTSVIPGGRN
jgi:hypothetical protein